MVWRQSEDDPGLGGCGGVPRSSVLSITKSDVICLIQAAAGRFACCLLTGCRMAGEACDAMPIAARQRVPPFPKPSISIVAARTGLNVLRGVEKRRARRVAAAARACAAASVMACLLQHGILQSGMRAMTRALANGAGLGRPMTSTHSTACSRMQAHRRARRGSLAAGGPAERVVLINAL